MILPLLLLLAAQADPETSGTAQPWQALGDPQPGVHLFYDPSPASRAGDTVTARMLVRYPAEGGEGQSVSLVEIRCGDRQARVIRTLSYAPDGRQIRDDDVPVPFDPIPEDSFFDVIAEALC